MIKNTLSLRRHLTIRLKRRKTLATLRNNYKSHRTMRLRYIAVFEEQRHN